MRKLIVAATLMLLLLAFSGQSRAGVSIGVNIPLPPVFTFSVTPELVVIPGTYVYYSPDVDFDLFFYGGFWYRPYGGYWYRGASYDGPWAYIETAPPVVISLPHDYRVITRGARRIPYAELHSNWRNWEREKYWERRNWGRAEGERHYGVAPSYKEGEHGGHQGVTPQRHQEVAPQRHQEVAPQLKERENQRHQGVAPQFNERGNQGHQGVAPQVKGKESQGHQGAPQVRGGSQTEHHGGSGPEGHEKH